MTSQSPRIYIYKITFEEVLYYYYGVHKEKKFGEYYMGSPITHKWCWDFYTPKKQILQFFDFTDEGWLEAQEIETRLIRPFYQTDKRCLNESCGGIISLDILKESGRKIGQKTYDLKVGVHGRSKEKMSEDGKKAGNSVSKEHLKNIAKLGGEKTYELKLGLHSLTKEQRSENGKKGGKKGGRSNKENKTGFCGRSPEKMSEDGKKSGKRTKELGVGIFAQTKEQRIEVGRKVGELAYKLGIGIHGRTKDQIIEDSKKGAKAINSQRWMCTETGFISTFGPLTRYQKARSIDTSKRVRIE
jgi:general stress protein YciG